MVLFDKPLDTILCWIRFQEETVLLFSVYTNFSKLQGTFNKTIALWYRD